MDIHMDIHGYPYEVLDILRKSELWISWISIWISKVSDPQMVIVAAHCVRQDAHIPIRGREPALRCMTGPKARG